MGVVWLQSSDNNGEECSTITTFDYSVADSGESHCLLIPSSLLRKMNQDSEQRASVFFAPKP